MGNGLRTTMSDVALQVPSAIRYSWLIAICAIVCAIALLAGCKRSMESTVQGVVTFNGKPLPRGAVTFYPKGKGAAAYATIQSDGTYQLQTGKTRGLATGEYTVAVSATEVQTREQAAALTRPKSIIPARYCDAETTDLQCTVMPGTNQINLTLKP